MGILYALFATIITAKSHHFDLRQACRRLDITGCSDYSGKEGRSRSTELYIGSANEIILFRFSEGQVVKLIIMMKGIAR
jgi:hypothetical protein